MKMKTKAKAFTLVELIIVIAIIAILAVSAFMVLTKWLWKSRDSRRLSDIGTIERSLTTWLSDYDANTDGKLPILSGTPGAYTLSSWALTISHATGFSYYFTQKLKNDDKGFDVLQKTVKDPADKDYLVAIDDNSWKFFGVAATLENDGNPKAAIRTNYQAGSNIIASDWTTAWSGNSIIPDSNWYQIVDWDTTHLPY